MSCESNLMGNLEKLSSQQLSAFTKLKALQSSDDAVNIVLQYDAQITAASQNYGIPKEIIQATIYREQVCLGIDDPFADSQVRSYYLGVDGAARTDSSTGPGQIFAWVAIDAECALNDQCTLNKNNPSDIWTVWQNLQDPTYNIKHVAMNLRAIANDQGITNLEISQT